MSDGMGRELAYLSSHATNRYFIPNWGNKLIGRHLILLFIVGVRKWVALFITDLDYLKPYDLGG